MQLLKNSIEPGVAVSLAPKRSLLGKPLSTLGLNAWRRQVATENNRDSTKQVGFGNERGIVGFDEVG